MPNNKKKKNKTALTVICVVIALVLVACAAAVWIWAVQRDSKATADDTGAANDTAAVQTTAAPQTTAPITESETTEPPAPAEDITIAHNSESASGALAGGGTASISVDSPKLTSSTYGENVDRFNELIATETESFKNEYAMAAASADNASLPALTYTMTFEVYKSDNGVISILLSKTTNYSGAHEGTTYKSVNFDLNSGKALTLSDVLPTDPSVYVPYVKTLILDKMRTEPQNYLSTEDTALDAYFRVEQFLITGSGIVIYFQPYDIAAGDRGLVTFELPYTELRTIMTY